MTQEIVVCSLWMRRYLQIIQPKLVLVYGAQAASIVSPKGPITQVHGKLYKHKEGFYVIPCIHPGAALRGGTKYSDMIGFDAEAIKDAVLLLGLRHE